MHNSERRKPLKVACRTRHSDRTIVAYGIRIFEELYQAARKRARTVDGEITHCGEDALALRVAAWNRWRSKHQDVALDFAGTDLRRAYFDGADLEEADFSSADLRNASLMDANLTAVSFEGAQLVDACLHRSELFGANLKGANLRGASLVDAKVWPLI